MGFGRVNSVAEVVMRVWTGCGALAPATVRTRGLGQPVKVGWTMGGGGWTSKAPMSTMPATTRA